MSSTDLNTYDPEETSTQIQNMKVGNGVNFNINNTSAWILQLVTVLSGLIIPLVGSVLGIANTWLQDQRTIPLYNELVDAFQNDPNLRKLIPTLELRKANFNKEGLGVLKNLYTTTRSRNNRNSTKNNNLRNRYETYLNAEKSRLKREKRTTTNANRISNINKEIALINSNNTTGYFNTRRVVNGKNFPENWNANSRYVPLHNTKFIKFIANESRERKNQAEMDIDELTQTMAHLAIAAWGYFKMASIMADNSELLLSLDMPAVKKMGMYTNEVYQILRMTAPTLARAKVLAGAKMAQGALLGANKIVPPSWKRTKSMIKTGKRLVENRSVLLGGQMALAAGTSAFSMVVDPMSKIKEVIPVARAAEQMAARISKNDAVFFSKLWAITFETAKEYHPTTVYAAQSALRNQLEAVNLIFFGMGVAFKTALYNAAKPVAAAGLVSAYMRSQKGPGVASRNRAGRPVRNMTPATRAITAANNAYLRYRRGQINGGRTLRLTNGRNTSSPISSNNERNNNNNNSGNNGNVNNNSNNNRSRSPNSPRSPSSNNNSNNNSK